MSKKKKVEIIASFKDGVLVIPKKKKYKKIIKILTNHPYCKKD